MPLVPKSERHCAAAFAEETPVLRLSVTDTWERRQSLWHELRAGAEVAKLRKPLAALHVLMKVWQQWRLLRLRC